MNTYIFNQSGACTCSANVELNLDNLSEGLIGVCNELEYNPSEIYYDGEIKLIKEFDLTISPNLVTGIPVGTQAFVSNEMQIVDDGSLELDVAFKGVVNAVFIHPHYKTMSVEVPCEV